MLYAATFKINFSDPKYHTSGNYFNAIQFIRNTISHTTFELSGEYDTINWRHDVPVKKRTYLREDIITKKTFKFGVAFKCARIFGHLIFSVT